MPDEELEMKLYRYEQTLKAIKDCTLTGTDFGDWVQAACEDALEGLLPECYNCGTFVHAGPCVEDEPAESSARPLPEEHEQ